MMPEIIPVILQAIGVAAAVATFFWRVQKSQNEKIMVEIVGIKNELVRLEELRRQGDHGCHTRIDDMETGIHKEIIERLSHIEGKLTGVENTNKTMIDWLVQNGGKIT